MVIEIIPKKPIRFPLWINILFYVSSFLFVVFIISFISINYFSDKALEKANKLESELIESKTEERISLIEDINLKERKISLFSQLIDTHYLPSKFLDFIEKVCYPRVSFSKLNLNCTEHSASLSGSTDSFSSLGQQILILEKDSMIEEIELSNIIIDKIGRINFSIDLVFKSELLKY